MPMGIQIGKNNQSLVPFYGRNFWPGSWTIGIIVTYLQAKNEVNRSKCSKVITRTDTQTDASETFTFPLLRAAEKKKKVTWHI